MGIDRLLHAPFGIDKTVAKLKVDGTRGPVEERMANKARIPDLTSRSLPDPAKPPQLAVFAGVHTHTRYDSTFRSIAR